MASRKLVPPPELLSVEPGVYGDIDAFMASFETGEQSKAWGFLTSEVDMFLDDIVARAMKFYSNNNSRPDPINEEDL